ncbi:hypothetical protein M569_01340 [Genlisea aurea]|uniref:ABC-type xenobiotic transporter n=1 Tax=Genlisea aurea TaxID=192259 RepID=S8D7L4_9LAMI|nr:hypothetical protein M569_01340 [Genlisea aurea]
MSSSSSWVTTYTCSAAGVGSSGISGSGAAGWVGFVLLSPCPQRLILSAVNVVFLAAVALFGVRRVWRTRFASGRPAAEISRPLISGKRFAVRTNALFKATLAAAAAVAVFSIVLSVLGFVRSGEFPWEAAEGLCWLFLGVAHAVVAGLVAHEKRFRAAEHPLVLRIFWSAEFVVLALFFVSGVARLTSGEESVSLLKLDDVSAIAVFLLSGVLLIPAIKGSTGIQLIENSDAAAAVVVDLNGTAQPRSKLDNVTGFSSASIVSKAFWMWMNPLLKKGYRSPLSIADVPSVSPEHNAERLSQQFLERWPKPEEKSRYPIVRTLIRCFWKQFAFTAGLAVLRLCVMYVGPTMIQRFVDYTSGKRTSPYEGYYLVGTLMAAKFVEIVSSHHFNFHTQKLGMLIRSTLITSLYKKGLRLSSSARQAHGVGQIVNYMAVDSQQVADMMLQLHNMWLMPLQSIVAFTILYQYLGTSTLSAMLGVVAVVAFVFATTNKSNFFQFNIMMSRDARMKATNEMLNYMRVIKFQAWEEHFNRRIQSIRETEFGWLSKFSYTLAANFVIMWSTPSIISTFTFGSAVILGSPLSVGTVFTTTSLLKMLQEPLRTFPQAIISFSQALISLERLDRYMTSRELADNWIERFQGCEGDTAVEVTQGSFGWEDDSGEATVKQLNFRIRKGQLAAVVGTVGSGKSSLLAAILGEMKKLSGKVKVCGSTAYVAQTAWIQNGTIRENILFGLPFYQDRYAKAVKVCSLEKDLEMMESGDQTEIGERGINLSGGQKQRIQLARAVYQDCDIYLLDDVFSAVDAHTGSDIFKECVRGALGGKTVILVTHQVDFLHNVDQILVMREGIIVQSGKYNELLNSGLDFKALVTAHESSMELVETGARNDESDAAAPTTSRQRSFKNPGEENGENGLQEGSEPNKGGKSSKLIKDEERATGNVGLNLYKIYSTESFGWWGVLGFLFLSLAWQGSLMSADYWLSYETSAKAARSYNASRFIGVYGLIALVALLILVARCILVAVMSLKTAQSFFRQILHCILHAPMAFFDTTPSGRILTRASSDQANVDFIIPLYMGLVVAMFITLLSVIIMTCQYAWPTFILLIPLAWINVWARGYYLRTSRELSRLDSITKAPVIHHFSESISGVMTIRSFRKQHTFCDENVRRVNANIRMDFHSNGANEWLGVRLELLGSLILCISAMFMIILPSSIIQPGFRV